MDTTLQNLNKLLKDMSLDPEKQHQEVINEVCLKRKNLGKPEKLKHLAMRVIISNGGLYLSRVANPFAVLPNTLVQEFLKFIMNEQKRVLGSTLIPLGLQEQFTILLLNENLTIFDDSILPKNSDQPNVAFFEHAVQNCPKVSFFAARDGGYDNWKTLLGLDNYLYSEVPLDILKLQNLRTLRLTTSVCTEEFIQQLGQQIPRLDWLEIVLLKSKLSAKAPEYFSKMLCLRGLVISTRGYGESVDIELLVQIVGSIPNIEVLSLAECPVSDNDNWMLKGILQIFFLEEFGRLYPNKQLLMISVFVPNFQQVTWPQNVIVEEFGIEGDVTADEILKVLLAMPRPPIRMVFSDVPFCSVYGALEKFGPHLQSVTIDQGVESSLGLDVQLGKLNLINIIELCPNLEGLILSDPGVQMEKISLNDARLLNLPLDTFKKWKMFDLNECFH
ncbi:uncharacterized protein LOC132199503 [Neocloeon triangulifer]|uniref:uncharacterized protein LOC132199503 n=1 Tax=Neocloeon triangulifer TaxID=2078957 RepID=UPI00286F6BA5|nr:uncharacterized protein LOC132199503 [Neocloeon triangulifer]